MNRRGFLAGLLALPFAARAVEVLATVRDAATLATANLRVDRVDCCTGCVWSRRWNGVSWDSVCAQHCTHDPCGTYEEEA